MEGKIMTDQTDQKADQTDQRSVDQRSILIGVVIAVVLYFLIGLILPAYSLYIAVFVAALITGYKVNQDYVTGSIHGSLVGLSTAVISILIIMIKVGFTKQIAGLIVILAVGYMGMSILLGALGGFVGSIIQMRR
jgi:hypothetical protein